jgi:hypothetical protein
MKKFILSLNLFIFFMSIGSLSFAELVSLDDEDLGGVDGAGIGIVLEDFVYEAGSQTTGGATFELSGLETSTGGPVEISISQFYIAGAGSDIDPITKEVRKGINVINNPVNIGRLSNPFNFELRDGNDADIGVANKAVLEFTAPKKGALASRAGERPDLGIRFDLEIDGAREQSLENHIESLSVDGSYIRLWGDGGKTKANLAINVSTPKMTFFACDSGGSNCGESVEFSGLSIEAELGYGDKQPVTFEVDSGGNFVFEVGSIKSLCGSIGSTGGCTSPSLVDFYANGPEANVHIGNVNVGGEDFGSSTISNLQIQYLRVQSHDL